MTIGVVALAGCSLAVLSAVVLGEGQAIRRGDAKAYRILGDTNHLPKLDRGEAERTLAIVGWQPLPRPADDPALVEPASRLQAALTAWQADVDAEAKRGAPSAAAQ